VGATRKNVGPHAALTSEPGGRLGWSGTGAKSVRTGARRGKKSSSPMADVRRHPAFPVQVRSGGPTVRFSGPRPRDANGEKIHGSTAGPASKREFLVIRKGA